MLNRVGLTKIKNLEQIVVKLIVIRSAKASDGADQVLEVNEIIFRLIDFLRKFVNAMTP